MKIYKAERDTDTEHIGQVRVTVNGISLDPGPSLKIWNHSPTGFEFGYGGSGSSQLALAILYDVTKNRQLSVRHHQRFMWDFIACADKGGFELTEYDVREWLGKEEREAS